MLSPCLIPQFVMYIQSAVRSPQSMFYTDRKPTLLDRVNRSKRCLLRLCARCLVVFIIKTKTIILFNNATCIALALGKQLCQLLIIFTFDTMKRRTCWCSS